MRDFQSLRQSEHIDCAKYARLRRLNWIELIMYGRGWTGEVINFIDFNKEREGHIVAKKFKTLIVEEVIDIAPCAGEEIIDAEDLMTLFQ